ncbi:transcription factor SPT20 homolog [Episyrphus balteatus]|uniref:transcription factor SPT20 homolog n=1 Tax=Episyrphus balteatus TaxID=286459 RepID=UPI002485041E|nr:transcription factor SPT20 homolog [Episyrphus balteatus]
MKNFIGLILIGLLIRHGFADVSHLSKHHNHNGYLPPQPVSNLFIEQDYNGINSPQSNNAVAQSQSPSGYDNESRGYLPPYQEQAQYHNHEHHHNQQQEDRGYLPPHLTPPAENHQHVQNNGYNQQPQEHQGNNIHQEDRGYLPPYQQQLQGHNDHNHNNQQIDPNLEVSYHNHHEISLEPGKVNHEHNKGSPSNEEYEDNSQGYNYSPPNQGFQEGVLQQHQQILPANNLISHPPQTIGNQNIISNPVQSQQEAPEEYHHSSQHSNLHQNEDHHHQVSQEYQGPSSSSHDHGTTFQTQIQQTNIAPTSSFQTQNNEESYQEEERGYLPPINALELPQSSDSLHIVPPAQLGLQIEKSKKTAPISHVNLPLPIPQVGYYFIPAVVTKLPSLGEIKNEQTSLEKNSPFDVSHQQQHIQQQEGPELQLQQPQLQQQNQQQQQQLGHQQHHEHQQQQLFQPEQHQHHNHQEQHHLEQQHLQHEQQQQQQQHEQHYQHQQQQLLHQEQHQHHQQQHHSEHQQLHQEQHQQQQHHQQEQQHEQHYQQQLFQQEQHQQHEQQQQQEHQHHQHSQHQQQQEQHYEQHHQQQHLQNNLQQQQQLFQQHEQSEQQHQQLSSDEVFPAEHPRTTASEIRIIPSIQTAQEISSQGYLTPTQVVSQHIADIEITPPETNHLEFGQQNFPPLIDNQQQQQHQDNFDYQQHQLEQNQNEVQNTHQQVDQPSQSGFENFAKSVVHGVNINQQNQISRTFEQTYNSHQHQENAYLPSNDNNHHHQQQAFQNQDQQVYNSKPLAAVNNQHNQVTNLQIYMASVNPNDRYGSLQFQPQQAIESNPPPVNPPIMYSKPSAVQAYAPGMAYKVSTNLPFTSFTQAGYLPPSNSRSVETQQEYSSSVGFELNEEAKKSLSQQTYHDNTIFPDILDGIQDDEVAQIMEQLQGHIRTIQITNHQDHSVKNLKVIDSSSQDGERTIEILGQSNEDPMGDHKIVHLISKVPNPQPINQTIKIFSDKKEAVPAITPLTASVTNEYLPPQLTRRRRY